MNVPIEKAALLKLSVEERYQLIQLILETFKEQQDENPLSDADYSELMRRLDDARANPDDGMSIDEFANLVRSRRA
ncbi:MAG: addiction module protein [Planctomycetes bacterium]|nr:addiction module protein [Planctomycetota bacterium]